MCVQLTLAFPWMTTFALYHCRNWVKWQWTEERAEAATMAMKGPRKETRERKQRRKDGERHERKRRVAAVPSHSVSFRDLPSSGCLESLTQRTSAPWHQQSSRCCVAHRHCPLLSIIAHECWKQWAAVSDAVFKPLVGVKVQNTSLPSECPGSYPTPFLTLEQCSNSSQSLVL